MRAKSGLNNDDPKLYLECYRLLEIVTLKQKHVMKEKEQLNILAPQTRELTTRLQQLESTDLVWRNFELEGGSKSPKSNNNNNKN